MTLAEDGRVTVYKKGDKHHLHIINATDADDGTYKMIVQGINVEADFEVSVGKWFRKFEKNIKKGVSIYAIIDGLKLPLKF